MAAHVPGPEHGPGIDGKHVNLGALYKQHYRAAFDAALAAGKVKPLVIPWSFTGSFFLPLVYLSIPHRNRPWLYRMRWLVAAAAVYLNARLMQTTSSDNEAVAFATGLVAVWGTIWSLRLLIFTRPQWEAARVERRPRRRRQKNENGPTEEKIMMMMLAAPDESVAAALPDNEYVWQRFPADAPFLARLAWTADLLTSFRGAGWNHAIPSIPHPPGPSSSSSSTLQCGDDEPARLDRLPLASSRSGARRCPTYAGFLRSRLAHLALSWLAIDFLTLAMRHDAYFLFGPVVPSSTSSTSHHRHLSSFLPEHRLLLPLARNLAALAGILSVLHLYTALLQLAVCLVPPLPALLGARAELWQHPALFGGFGAGVLDRGLAGFWGGWWHQTFRLGFIAPGRWVFGGNSNTTSVTDGNGNGNGVGKGKGEGKGKGKGKGKRKGEGVGVVAVAELALAFLQSGLLHAAGGLTAVTTITASSSSSSSLSTRRPMVDPVSPAWAWTTPVIFFLLQAVGVLLQTGLCALLRPGKTATPLPLHLPRWIRRAGNLLFVAGWLHLTAWGLVDDLSRAGLWLFEPVPVSPLRMMGFGSGESWWRWDGVYGPRWYTGRHWWESGIRL
ncbi:hypothetical protein VTK56DRAFT_484 [Thermocarpiscus australiensis]